MSDPLLSYLDYEDTELTRDLLIQLTTQKGDSGLSTPPLVSDTKVNAVIAKVARKTWNKFWLRMSRYVKPLVAAENDALVASPELYALFVDYSVYWLAARRPLIGATAGVKNAPKSFFEHAMDKKKDVEAEIEAINNGDMNLSGLVEAGLSDDDAIISDTRAFKGDPDTTEEENK